MRKTVLQTGEAFVPEWEVLRKVVRRCVCRGAVTVEDFPSAGAIEAAVVVHQRSDEHQEWRERGGMFQRSFPVRVANHPGRKTA